MQLLHYILKCNHLEWRWLFGPFMYILIQTVCFLSTLLASLIRNYFPKRPSVAPLHTLSKLYDVPVGFDPPPYFETVYCFICGRRRMSVAGYRMICLVLSRKCSIVMQIDIWFSFRSRALQINNHLKQVWNLDDHRHLNHMPKLSSLLPCTMNVKA